MPRLIVNLNRAEVAALDAAAEAAGVSPQALIRAGLYLYLDIDHGGSAAFQARDVSHMGRTPASRWSAYAAKIVRLARRGRHIPGDA